jgi:hypothetical protein
MQMNKQNRRRLTLASFLAVLVLLIAAVSSSAAENEPPKQQPEPAAQKPAETSAETTIDPAKTPQSGQPAPAAVVTPIKQFEPSEKIGADSAVAFPIDI